MSIASKIRGAVATVRALASTHAGQQVGRFVRVGAVAAGTAWVSGGHVLSWAGLSAAAAGGVEVAYRQWKQTVLPAQAEVVVPEPDPAPAPVPAGVVPASDPSADAPAEGSLDGGVPDPSQGL